MHSRTGRFSKTGALLCALAVLAGCEGLLEVNLPDAVTSAALEDSTTASLQVNSVMAGVECGYSSFIMDAAGMADNFQMVTGVAGNYSQYAATAGGGGCDGDAYSTEWNNPFLIARGQGYDTYQNISEWNHTDRAEMLATTAMYTAIILDIYGEYFCEFAVDTGPLLTPSATLTLAEAWVDSVFVNITRAGGDFAITTQQGTQTTSIQQMAYGLRSRIRWARNGAGDVAAAAADGAMVSDDHVSWVLREAGEDRRNMVSSMHGGGGGVQAAGFLQGPVKLKTDLNAYGISQLGTHPTGTAWPGGTWPNPVPFTGYIDLALTAEGMAVDGNGNAITAATMGVGGEDDPRVEHVLGNTSGGTDWLIQKYTSLDDDMPLVNYREMRLIQAEAAGAGAAGVALVNAIRDDDDVINITGAYQVLVEGDADAYENMIIEERRRALWLEGRFWSTKIRHNDKLWFPREVGSLVNPGAIYDFGGGVRLRMSNTEYDINPNLSRDDRATGCAVAERPTVGN